MSLFHDLQTVEKDGRTWYIAAEICAQLGMTDPTSVSRAVAALPPQESGMYSIHTATGSRNVLCVSELAATELVARSRHPNARAFLRAMLTHLRNLPPAKPDWPAWVAREGVIHPMNESNVRRALGELGVIFAQDTRRRDHSGMPPGWIAKKLVLGYGHSACRPYFPEMRYLFREEIQERFGFMADFGTMSVVIKDSFLRYTFNPYSVQLTYGDIFTKHLVELPPHVREQFGIETVNHNLLSLPPSSKPNTKPIAKPPQQQIQ